jgi:hypothetical protein
MFPLSSWLGDRSSFLLELKQYTGLTMLLFRKPTVDEILIGLCLVP